jgi:hypothetical protein
METGIQEVPVFYIIDIICMLVSSFFSFAIGTYQSSFSQLLEIIFHHGGHSRIYIRR